MSVTRRPVGTLSAVLSLALLAGCATPPPANDTEAVAEYDQANDPFEPTNRSIFEFNRVVDKAVFKPIAEAYRDYVSDDARNRLHDLIDNWRGPLRFLEDLAQGDVDRASQTLVRFALNTGVGLGGLVDVATPSGIPGHQTDTGATFGVWGIGEGPYLVLPILGPSNPRDFVGMAIDYEFDPVDYRLEQIGGYGWVVDLRAGLVGLDKREQALDPLDEIERTSLDLYSSIRSLYRQHREAEIHHKPDLDKLPIPGLTSSPGAGPELSQEMR